MTIDPHSDTNPEPARHLPSRVVRDRPLPGTHENQPDRARAAERCPSPAGLPRRRPAAASQNSAAPSLDAIPQPDLLGWALAETLADSGETVVVAEGDKLKSLGKLDRTRIAQSRRASAAISALVHQCLATRKRQYRDIPGTHPLAVHVVPAVGPSGAVLAVQLWAGTASQKPPQRGPVGTVEWDAATGVAELNTALERQLGIPAPLSRPHYTLPDLLSHIDGFDDFLGFLDLFDRASTVDRWVGTVTTPGRFSMIRRHLRIVARVHFESGNRRVRAIVHDITTMQPPPPPHVDSVTLAGYPTSSTNAIARIDLGTGLINRWICLSPGTLEPWAYQNPEIDTDGTADIARCCAQLHRGATTATADLRIRFAHSNTWIPVHAEWIALPEARRPQALVVLVPGVPGT
ncbi:GAF domain-containing protein [Nocardia wallacei]|uniref:GAF domain-containing protein n=1 Tax=Nocardia wallacei TaxID=480035 RepID=UPI0024566ED9|nr:GAF domain-containing protein [Nocardia wallacei]